MAINAGFKIPIPLDLVDRNKKKELYTYAAVAMNAVGACASSGGDYYFTPPMVGVYLTGQLRDTEDRKIDAILKGLAISGHVGYAGYAQNTGTEYYCFRRKEVWSRRGRALISSKSYTRIREAFSPSDMADMLFFFCVLSERRASDTRAFGEMRAKELAEITGMTEEKVALFVHTLQDASLITYEVLGDKYRYYFIYDCNCSSDS